MGMNSKHREELEEFVERIKNYRARHTELITVLVPAGFDINLITKQLESEKSTAANIKSTTTRKNVQEALESLIRITKGMKQTPAKGVGLFAGNVSQTEGQDDFVVEAFEPPEELNVRLYRCDQNFVVDPFEEMLEEKEIYGLVVIDRKEATIGLLVGKKIQVLHHFDSFVPGKTTKGGQSSARYARIREGMAKEFFRKVGEVIKKEFFNRENLKGILVGGPGPTKEDFLKEGNIITAVQEKILGVKDLGYSDEHGLELLVEESEDLLAEQEIVIERKLLEKFFNMLGKDKEKTAYGEKEVERALSMGAVEKVLLSKKLDKEKIKFFQKKAAETSAEVSLVSTDTDEGNQFLNLGGVGGMLRFKIG
jgi:peptide chain release factor subunit 1